MHPSAARFFAVYSAGVMPITSYSKLHLHKKLPALSDTDAVAVQQLKQRKRRSHTTKHSLEPLPPSEAYDWWPVDLSWLSWCTQHCWFYVQSMFSTQDSVGFSYTAIMDLQVCIHCNDNRFWVEPLLQRTDREEEFHLLREEIKLFHRRLQTYFTMLARQLEALLEQQLPN